MYLQELRAIPAEFQERPWAARRDLHPDLVTFWHDGPKADDVLNEVDDTLNSWKEAHQVFDSFQGARPKVEMRAFQAMKGLVYRVIKDRLQNSMNSWAVEALAYALLVRWIKVRQADLQMRLQQGEPS